MGTDTTKVQNGGNDITKKLEELVGLLSPTKDPLTRLHLAIRNEPGHVLLPGGNNSRMTSPEALMSEWTTLLANVDGVVVSLRTQLDTLLTQALKGFHIIDVAEDDAAKAANTP